MCAHGPEQPDTAHHAMTADLPLTWTGATTTRDVTRHHGFPASHNPLAGLGVVTAALTYLMALMTFVVVRQLRSLAVGRRRMVETAVGQLRWHQWTITLLALRS
jgi:hypothetical protein